MLRVIEYFAESLRSFEMTLLSRARVSLYWYFIETMSVCRTVYEIFSVKEWHTVTLKLGVGVVQGQRKWRRSIDHTRLSNWSAIVSIAVCCTIFKLFDGE